MEKIKVSDVYKDFAVAYKAQAKLNKEMKKDLEFALGKQWDEEDVRRLKDAHITPLTINKIRPMIKIISGIERQNRSDYLAYPQGGEDSLIAEVVTHLLKHVVNVSRADRKLSDSFKEGMTCGLCYLEPYIDYTYDLINGELKIRKVSATRIYSDPNGEEYDLSDRRYLIKFTPGLTKDQLLQIFPDKEKDIEEMGRAKVDLAKLAESADDNIQGLDYPPLSEAKNDEGDGDFDLVEHYYRKLVKKFIVVSKATGEMAEFEKKDEADSAAAQMQDAVIFEKNIPEMYFCQVVGDKKFYEGKAWCYPRWKDFPFIPFIAEYMPVDIDDEDLKIQGITRGLRDLQVELNKRRVQEMVLLNTSINSALAVPKGALDSTNKAIVKEHGSAPGLMFEYDPTVAPNSPPNSWRMTPTPLSQAHAQLAAENAQDIQECSGINPSLLANDSNSDSGRAILLKQKQGMVMIQESLDNYSDTKKLLGRFILSQLGEIFTVELAVKVLGDRFIADNFQKPAVDEMGNPVTKADGNFEMTVDQQEVGMIINKILNDSLLGKFDVSIGEGTYNETAKYANFSMLMDMSSKGIPIPPEVVIEESMLSDAQKKKITGAIEQAQQMQMAPQQQPQGVM